MQFVHELQPFPEQKLHLPTGRQSVEGDDLRRRLFCFLRFWGLRLQSGELKLGELLSQSQQLP